MWEHNASTIRSIVDEVNKLTEIRIGVSFTNLNCHGFTTGTPSQKTLLGHMAALPKLLGSIVGFTRKREVQILRDFEGLVLPGEMLLVLGRPGSGCSTFLKALAGDTGGFHLGPGIDINYHGKPEKLVAVVYH
jgi:ATP-binding cassette, subfamily G (WHITE), member 2, PDR